MRRLSAVAMLWFGLSCVPAVTPEGPHLLWSADEQSLENPFPDARLFGASGLSLRTNWYRPFLAPKALGAKAQTFFRATGAAMQADVKAFGAFGGTLLLPSEPMDAASVAGHFARLRKTSDGWVVLERSVRAQHSTEVLTEAGVPAKTDFPEYVFVRPSVPLLEGSDGVLVVLAGLKSADGRAFERGRQWASSKHEDLSALATALGVHAADVLLVLPQQASVGSSTMSSLARWAEANVGAVTIPAKGIVPDDNNGRRPEGVWSSQDADWSTMSQWLETLSFGRPAVHVGTVVVGEFAAKDLRDDTGRFTPANVDNPTNAPAVSLRFVLSLPTGPKPAGGWPVVMAQHGVGGRNTPRVGTDEAFCLAWAEPLAALGLGCIGIDAPNHGSRGSFASFFVVENLPALRDRFREMTFDLLQEERVLATIDIDHDGVPDLNPNARYFGNSLGSIFGAGFVPFANHLTSATLNVPGAGLSNVITSPKLHDALGLLLVAQTDVPFGSAEYYAAFPLFRVAAQPFFEIGDPVNFIDQVPASRAVLLQEGLGDQTIPNDSTDDLAAALGANVSSGAQGQSPLRVITKVDPAKYFNADQLENLDPHNIMYDIGAARAQVLGFLGSDGRVLTAP